MRKTLATLLAGSLLTFGGAAQAKSMPPEERLAHITAGRIAGEPVDCIFLRNINSSEIVSNTAIVYRMNNGTVMINRPASGARFLDRGDVLVTDTRSPRLCSVDIVRLYDNSLRMPSGSVGLGQFVPYPRAARASAR